MPKQPYTRYRCPKCGTTDNCGNDATAGWNEDTQSHELRSIYDDQWCNDCGEVSLLIEDITDPADIQHIEQERAKVLLREKSLQLLESLRCLMPMAELHHTASDPETVGGAVIEEARKLLDAFKDIRPTLAHDLEGLTTTQTNTIATPELTEFTFWIRQANNQGTTWIGSVQATDATAAKDLALDECVHEWGNSTRKNDLHILGIATGTTTIVEWQDLEEI